MTYRIIIEPTAEREIRAAVRWKTQHASPTVAAWWYNGPITKIGALHRHPSRCPLAAENVAEGKRDITDIDRLRKEGASGTCT